MKAQWVRVVDVTVLGPFMIYVGARKSNLPAFFKIGLIISGGLTILYNGKNWLEVHKLEKESNPNGNNKWRST